MSRYFILQLGVHTIGVIVFATDNEKEARDQLATCIDHGMDVVLAKAEPVVAKRPTKIDA
jgi:hypothetical protein